MLTTLCGINTWAQPRQQLFDYVKYLSDSTIFQGRLSGTEGMKRANEWYAGGTSADGTVKAEVVFAGYASSLEDNAQAMYWTLINAANAD